MQTWPWFVGAAVLVALGSVLWFTAWIAWPVAVIFGGLGAIRWLRVRAGQPTL